MPQAVCANLGCARAHTHMLCDANRGAVVARPCARPMVSGMGRGGVRAPAGRARCGAHGAAHRYVGRAVLAGPTGGEGVRRRATVTMLPTHQLAAADGAAASEVVVGWQRPPLWDSLAANTAEVVLAVVAAVAIAVVVLVGTPEFRTALSLAARAPACAALEHPAGSAAAGTGAVVIVVAAAAAPLVLPPPQSCWPPGRSTAHTCHCPAAPPQSPRRQ